MNRKTKRADMRMMGTMKRMMWKKAMLGREAKSP
jgi:hypothetical protein